MVPAAAAMLALLLVGSVAAVHPATTASATAPPRRTPVMAWCAAGCCWLARAAASAGWLLLLTLSLQSGAAAHTGWRSWRCSAPIAHSYTCADLRNAWNTFSVNGKPMRGGRQEYETIAEAMVESGMVAAVRPPRRSAASRRCDPVDLLLQRSPHPVHRHHCHL
jgi:hypothetical protein